jgi:predicted TIM-barrel fold metal-dependent hydrolase
MIYNCHIHTFREPDVPRKFLPLCLVRILANTCGFRFIARILNNLNPLSDNDIFDRYVRFAKISRIGSQREIFKECERFYPVNSRFIVMSMDMAYMSAGKVPRPYEQQLNELEALRDAYPDQVIPFIHIDPRREGVMDLLRKCVEQKGFKGVKLYPPLGYYPYDPLLMNEVYPYCEEKNLPVISHGSPYNPVRNKGSRKEICRLLGKPADNPELKGKKKKELTSYFTHPNNYRSVFDRFKKLKICMAHFGSEYYWKEFIENPGNDNNWFLIIKQMLADYENLYTDISFTLNKQGNFPLLKVLLTDNSIRNKILFGSDFYMLETEADERRYGLDLRAYLGEENFNTIAVHNVENFLG